MALPKTIYVYQEAERDGTKYLVATEDKADLGGVDTKIVGVYTLGDTLHVRAQTQFRRQKTKMWFPA